MIIIKHITVDGTVLHEFTVDHYEIDYEKQLIWYKRGNTVPDNVAFSDIHIVPCSDGNRIIEVLREEDDD